MSDAPQVIHRYAILERLGRGGMGEVFLAHDPTLDRHVAVKVLLSSDLEGDELRERFAREARAAARLTHSNIVTIYDVGHHDGQPYIAMEYVSGETLFKKIQRRTPLTLASKLKYIDELCAGLGHAHRAGIVHRDIKPINLIISDDDVLKILDFGIARLADSNMTQAGVVMGTLNYMSPEQVAGLPVDHRSDIFAVGAVSYELLSFQQAFPGRIDTGVFARIMEGVTKPLAQAAPGLDERLVRIVHRALAKNPADRYADLNTMRTELAEVRAHLDPVALESSVSDDQATVKISPAGPPVPPPRSTPRRGGADRGEIQRRRAAEIAHSLASARDAFAEGHFEEASAACERVLVLEPDHEEAHRLDERARAAIEQNQIREWMVEGRAELAHGNLTRARDLASFVLSLDAACDDARALREAVEQTQQAQEAGAAIERGRAALQNGDAVGAIAATLDAIRADPGNADAEALRHEADRLLTEQRRHAEHDRRAHAVVAEARRRFANEPAAAVALLQAFTPPHKEVSEVLHELRALREQDFERSRQAEQARVKSEGEARQRAVAEARQQEEAEAKLQGEQLARQRAQEAERHKSEEFARKKAEIEARVAVQMAERAALEESRRADEKRRLDAQNQAAEADRKDTPRREAEAARRRAEADRPLEQTEIAVRPEGHTSGQPRAAGDAAPAVPVPLLSPPVTRPAVRQGVGALPMAAIAVAAVLVLAIGFGVWRWTRGDDTIEPRPVAAAATDPAATAKDDSPAAPPGSSVPTANPPSRPVPDVVAASPPDPAPSPPPPLAPAAPSPMERQLEPFRQQARQQLEQNQPVRALAAVEKGLRLSPTDASLLALVTALLRGAQDANARAKQAAINAGSQKSAEALFSEGVRKEAEAMGPNRTADTVSNIRSLWAAAELFDKAAGRAREVTEKAAAEDAMRLRETEEKRLADAKLKEIAEAKARQIQPADTKPKEPPRLADTPPVVVPPVATTTATPSKAAAGATDEEGIRETLRQYEAAYEHLDVAAVSKVYPGVRAEQLAAAFRQYRSYDMQIQIEDMQFSSTRASVVVLARVTYAFQPVAGRRITNTATQRFTLQKEGTVWRIDGIR